MRILQVCAVDFTAYHFLAPLMRACRDLGWTVEFACARGRWVDLLEREDFRYRGIPISRARSPLEQGRAIAAMASSLRRDPPDLLHTHTPIGGLVGRSGALAVPDLPVAHTLHGLPFETAPRGVAEAAFLMIERILARRTAFFFSQAAGDATRAARLGIARIEDTMVIGNGVDTDRFAPDIEIRQSVRDELGLPDGAVLTVAVGRLVREKGFLDLADAAAACADLRPLHMAVVGQSLPSDREPLDATIDRHPVVLELGSRWLRLGHRQDVDRILKAADIFVLPSHREGLPRSVIEAMATGLPAVVTDLPGNRELIEAEVTGLIVPMHDPVSLAGAIRRLVRDPELRYAMGRRARERALARHREGDVVARQLPVLARLAARR